MTALEKIGPSPTRLGGTALYDWDHLVQEDRAHRLIYTDPAYRRTAYRPLLSCSRSGEEKTGFPGGLVLR